MRTAAAKRPLAVLLDGGGTIVLPARVLVAEALARAGVEIDPGAVPAAHYEAARALDRGLEGGYVEALCAALGTAEPAAVASLSEMADRSRSGRVLWSEPVPGAVETIVALRRAGVAVVIVTNSDGHAAENLRDAAVLEATGLTAAEVVDSAVVGSIKPDTDIFEVALARAGVGAADAVHVGDMVSTDVVGARAAGITPVHLDPYGLCRERDHRHIGSLAALVERC